VFGLLALLFLLVPLAELVVIIRVGSEIGALNTIALLVLISLLGAWLVRREGLSVLSRAQREVDAGRVPTTSLVDGLLILAAGALLLTPGFLTDIVGVLLLLPPVRAVVRRGLAARFRRRLASQGAGGPRVTVWRTARGGPSPNRPRNVVDVEEHEDPSDPLPPSPRSPPPGASGERNRPLPP
jgi:UPF0716 protein FxsA